MSDFVTIHRLITVEMDQAFAWREAWFDRMGDVVRFSEIAPSSGGGRAPCAWRRRVLRGAMRCAS